MVPVRHAQNAAMKNTGGLSVEAKNAAKVVANQRLEVRPNFLGFLDFSLKNGGRPTVDGSEIRLRSLPGIRCSQNPYKSWDRVPT